MIAKKKEEIELCSFCGYFEFETGILIRGTGGNICSFCVDRANIITEEAPRHEKNKGKKATNVEVSLETPQEIKHFLGQYVIGQDFTKKILSVVVYNHYERLQQPDVDDKVGVQKSNVIMVGGIGTSRILVACTVAKTLNVPIAIVDVTILTEAGYVGEGVESILSRLLQTADYDVAKTERGIVFTDETDKIVCKSDNPSITRDISGEGIQQALLRLLEGSIVNVPPRGGRKHPGQKYIEVNTEHTLSIAGGVFNGIGRVIFKRLNMQAVGYNSPKSTYIDHKNLVQYIIPKNLKDFGLISEIIGRLPVLTYMNPLDRHTLRMILTEPKNVIIEQYQKPFEMGGIRFEVTEEALDFIVEKALEYKLGARGLYSLCENILTDAIFKLPDSGTKNLAVTKEYVEEKLNKSALQIAS